MAPPPRKATILIVEEDRALRTFYQSALMMAGYKAVTLGDGPNIEQRIDRYKPAAVVLDIDSRWFHGPSSTIGLAERLRDIPLLVLTADDTSPADEGRYACLLQKPVTPESLVAAIERCLSR